MSFLNRVSRGGRACALSLVLATVAAGALCAAPVRASDVNDFVGDPVMKQVRLSPSGKFLAMVRSDGLTDVLVVQDLQGHTERVLLKTRPGETKMLELDARQRISAVRWKTDERLIVSVDVPEEMNPWYKAVFGSAALHFVIKRDGSGSIPLNHTAVMGKRIARVAIVDSLPNDDTHILLGRDDDGVDRVDVRDGSKVMVEPGGPRVYGYGADRNGVIITRLLLAGTEQFPYFTLQARAPGETVWTKVWDIHKSDLRKFADIEVLGAAPGVGQVWVAAEPKTPADGDTTSIRTFDLKTKTLGPIVWRNANYDASNVIVDEASGAFRGACYIKDVEVCDYKDPASQARYRGLSKFFEDRASVDVTSVTKDDTKWVLTVASPEEPRSFYLFDQTTGKLDPIGAAFPRMQAAGVGVVKPFAYKARDGVELTGYVTTPPGKGPFPLVVMPHGGPEVRDSLGFDVWAQYLASRGYVVLQPNFRGSAGFGRKHAEAGYGQWGGRMQDDVTDAAKALIATGAVDPSRVCVVGASYGGYVALYAAATQADLYKCAASIDGVTDLLDTIGEARKNDGADSEAYKYVTRLIGDPSRDEAKLKATSPTHMAAQVRMPVLIIHGEWDSVVDIAQAEKMKRALEGAGKSVRYLEIKGMGHGPSLDKDTRKVLTEVSTFLDSHIGSGAPAR